MRPTVKETNKATATQQPLFEVERIFKLENNQSLKAFVDIKVAQVLLIKGVRVLANKEGGLFVSMPAEKATDGKYYPNVRTLTKESKEQLQDAVLAAYQV